MCCSLYVHQCVCLLQLKPLGQTGDLGQAAQKPVGGGGQIDIARAQAARLVQEIRAKQNGATPTHATASHRRHHVSQKGSLPIHFVHVQTLIHHVGVMLLARQFLMLFLVNELSIDALLGLIVFGSK